MKKIRTSIVIWLALSALTTQAQQSINVGGHFEGKGDITPIMEGQFCTYNANSRLEALWISRLDLSLPRLTYQADLEGLGKTAWVWDGEVCGTKGQSRRVNGFAIKFSPENPYYSVNYRVVYNPNNPICLSGDCTIEITGSDGQFVGAPNGNKIVGFMVYISKKNPGPPAVTRSANPCPAGATCTTVEGTGGQNFGGIIFYRPLDAQGNCTKNLASFPASDLVSMTKIRVCSLEGQTLDVLRIIYKTH
jgi:hypothetical protein